MRGPAEAFRAEASFRQGMREFPPVRGFQDGRRSAGDRRGAQLSKLRQRGSLGAEDHRLLDCHVLYSRAAFAACTGIGTSIHFEALLGLIVVRHCRGKRLCARPNQHGIGQRRRSRRNLKAARSGQMSLTQTGRCEFGSAEVAIVRARIATNALH